MARCGSPLPLVRTQTDVTPAATYAFTRSMLPLVAMMRDAGDLNAQQAYLLETRFLPMIDAAEGDGKRLHRWDKWLFLTGFTSSLFVTVIAAILQSNYLGDVGSAVIATSILVVSSLGTATVALRERLKFKEQGDIAQQMSTFLQKITFNFFSCNGRYRHARRGDAFVVFARDVENAKRDMDLLRLSLTDDTRSGAGAGGGGGDVTNNTGAAAAFGVSSTTPPGVSAATDAQFYAELLGAQTAAAAATAAAGAAAQARGPVDAAPTPDEAA
jgi:hypothetical protein